MRKEVVIDIKDGCIAGRDDIVSLRGNQLSEDSSYIDNLSIVIKVNGDEEKEYPLKIGGYNFRMVLGKFSDSKLEDILIYGETGGTGNYVIANVYKYNNGKLLEIFNADLYADKYKIKGRYLENYNIELVCEKLKKIYVENISRVNKESLNNIYDEEGKIITDTDPTVSYINEVKIIQDINSELLYLQTYQRIIGVANANTLGGVQSLISLEDSKIKILQQKCLNEGSTISDFTKMNSEKNEIINKLPEDSILINLNKFGGRNGVIKKDIDGDGRAEIICGYKNKDTQYLAIFREEEGTVKFLDNVEGSGYDISDLFLEKLNQRNDESIILGWKIGSIWSVLEILEFKNDKFIKTLKGEKLNYSKIEIFESNNHRNGKSIAIWNHETGQAYKVQLYTLRGNILEKTYKDDKEYFTKVEEYYKNLINKSRETPQYLYYLIDAQCKIGKKKEALENVNKALKNTNPYPSIQELRRIKKNI